MTNYVAYYRVSTQKQGRSGLGLEAQRSNCENFVKGKGGAIVREFTDVESGSSRSRSGLWAAIEYAQKNRCALVIAKLDRLARDVEFTFKVINTGIEIHFADMPVVNTMILGVFASVAQYERELISTRTKAALRAKKERGETWDRGSAGIQAAQIAASKMRTDERLEWTRTAPLPKYCRARWEQGWSFYQILDDASQMYDSAPEIYCTRKGKRLSKSQLWKWICLWREDRIACDMSEKERRNS
jgi:DNA invertase Pin-like site-specific DNA recombinase